MSFHTLGRFGLLALALLTGCASSQVPERCRFVTEHVRRPTMPAELATVDRLLVERTLQTVLQCRELKRSYSVAFRINFAERLLPELCERLERARALASRGDALHQAGGAYQGLLLASQVVQLTVAVMAMAESADAAGQPSGQIEQILDVFVRQMSPLLEAAFSEDPRRIEQALAGHGRAYATWISYVDRWSRQVQTSAEQVQTAKYLWDAAMMVAAAHEAATGLAEWVASGRPPGPPFALSGAGTGALTPGAYLQLTDALRKLIAQGALNASVITALGKMIPAPGASGAISGLPDPSLPTALQMGTRQLPPNMAKVRKINGRFPQNAEYAGRTYDKLPDALRAKYPSSVRFDEEGFPDFRPYAVKEVQIEITGDRTADAARANRVAGYQETPKGFSWHHHQDCRTMQLVPRDLHDAVRHSGGSSILKGSFD